MIAAIRRTSLRAAARALAPAATLALASAPALTAADARAAVSVTSFAVTPSSAQAGASPTLTQEIRFAAGAGDTVKDLILALPAGLLANPAVGPPCAVADLEAGTCPAASRVDDGTSTVSVTAFGIPANAEAQLYLLAPQPGELARLGLVTAFGGVRVVSQGPVTARTATDAGIDVAFRDLPATVPGTSEPLTIDAVRLALPGTVNGTPFTRSPTSCEPATTRLGGVSHAGDAFAAESAFTPTGCDLLPFAPSLAASAAVERGKDGVAVETVVGQAAGEAAVKNTKLSLPAGLTPRLTAVTRACALPDPGACPESATVGSASVTTPLLPGALEGRVVLVAGTPLPGLAIVLPAPFPLRLAGTSALGAGGMTATFAGIPDVPISRLRVSFAGGPQSLFTGSRALCDGPLDARAEFGAHSGKAAQAAARLAVSGCRPPASQASRPAGSVSLRGIAGRNPVLTLVLRAAPSGSGQARAFAAGSLRSAIVRLPRGLAVARHGLARSVRVVAGGRAVRGAARVAGGRLRVRLRGAGTRHLRVTIRRPALRVSPDLARRARARRAKRLSFRVTVGASGVSPAALTLRATPRR